MRALRSFPLAVALLLILVPLGGSGATAVTSVGDQASRYADSTAEAATPTTPTIRERRAASKRAKAERKVIQLTNKKRAKKGCKKVTLHPALRRAARKHTRLMAEHGASDPNDGLSHQLPGEPSLRKRIVRAGYKKPRILSENVAYNSNPSPAVVVRAWMDSPYGHRENILNCSVRHIGVGLVISNGVAWWTQNFGRR